jgi:hypothetical protein
MKFFSPPVNLLVYLYALTLVVQSGYAAYYDLPVSVLGNSIFSDILFLKFTFLHIVTVYLLKHKALTVLGVVLVTIVRKFSPKSAAYLLLTLGAFLLFSAQTIGAEIAKNNRVFYSFKKECSPFKSGKDVQYLASLVDFQRNNAAFLMVSERGVLQKDFVVAPVAQSLCGLEIVSATVLKL